MPTHGYQRRDRVGALLRRELGVLVHAAVRDHALPSVSVTDVEVTRDLDFAKVWVVALLPGQSHAAIEALNHMAPEFRHQLSRQLRHLRRMPELRFHYDESMDRGERIDKLLREDPQNPS